MLVKRRRGPPAGGLVEEHDALATSPNGSLNVVPRFRASGAEAWKHDFVRATADVVGPLELDVLAVASMLSFQYVIDGHSMVSQVERRRWLADVGPADGGQVPAALAGYGRRLMGRGAAAAELLARLRLELHAAFAEAERITVLLSGGLDSRLATAVLVGLGRRGRVTDRIRAVTWGMAASRDRHYGRRVARHLGVEWIPVELGPSDLAENVGIVARELGGLISPVHLHAMSAVRQLDWHAGDRVLAATFGNGVGRGQYLNRHVSQAKPVEPRDWLGLMRPELYARARPKLVAELAAFRRRLRAHGRIAVHECEMLAHYLSGVMLPPFDVIRTTAAPLHQALSDPGTYGFMWSLSPMIRTQSLYRAALRLCDPELLEIPQALSGRPARRLGRRTRDRLSPYVHRYPIWIAHDLAETIDAMLSRAWFDETGVFDGRAVRRAWEGVRGATSPHRQTAYVLVWLCTLRRLVEELGIRGGDDASEATARDPARPVVRPASSPPWGFAGRDPDSAWRRLASRPARLASIVRRG